MRIERPISWTIVASTFAFALVGSGACGSSESSNGSTVRDNGDASPSNASSSSSGGSSGQASGGGGDAGTGDAGSDSGSAIPVNGCTKAGAQDHRTKSNVDIHFPGSVSQPRFTPACIRISVGSTVTFIPDDGYTFHDHGIYAGTKVDGTAQSDPASPIPKKDSKDSTPLVVQLDEAGAYGFYCPFHGYLGEQGAIFVE